MLHVFHVVKNICDILGFFLAIVTSVDRLSGFLVDAFNSVAMLILSTPIVDTLELLSKAPPPPPSPHTTPHLTSPHFPPSLPCSAAQERQQLFGSWVRDLEVDFKPLMFFVFSIVFCTC